MSTGNRRRWTSVTGNEEIKGNGEIEGYGGYFDIPNRI